MKRMFLKFLVIILVISGFQINQIKADDTASIIAGSILGTGALGALIVAIYKRDKILEKWNNFKNNLGSVKQQTGLTAAEKEELFRNTDFLARQLGIEIDRRQSGSQSADETVTNIVARVSKSLNRTPSEVMDQVMDDPDERLRNLIIEERRIHGLVKEISGQITPTQSFLTSLSEVMSSPEGIARLGQIEFQLPPGAKFEGGEVIGGGRIVPVLSRPGYFRTERVKPEIERPKGRL